LVSGAKIIEETLKNPKLKVSAALLPNENDINKFRHLDRVFTLSAPLFKELDVLGTHSPLLVVEIPKFEKVSDFSEPSGLEVVIPLSDPSNVGALGRRCVAFGASKIILTQQTANPFLPKALRASSGSSLIAPFVLGPSLKELIKNPLQS